MDPALELRACVPAHAECSTGRAASLDAGLQSAAVVRLSPAGSLPPTEGSYRHHPSRRRSHASRSGHSARAYSLGHAAAEHELMRRRTRANGAARTHRLLTSPHLRFARGGSFTQTEPPVVLTASCTPHHFA